MKLVPKKRGGGGLARVGQEIIRDNISTISDALNPITLHRILDVERYNLWDKLQNQYLNSGNEKALQRLRDGHFIAKAPWTITDDTNGWLQHLYHGSDTPGITQFNIGGRQRSSYTDFLNPRLYLTSSKEGAKQYAKSKDYTKALLLEQYFDGGFGPEEAAQMLRWSPAEVSRLQQKFNIGADFLHDDVDQSTLLYDLYANMRPQKSVIVDNYNQPIQFMNDEVQRAVNSQPSAIIKHVDERVKDTYGLDSPFVINDYVVSYPEQVKLAAHTTYDDNGMVIPMSKRDNFKNPDIRYGWAVPWVVGGSTVMLGSDKFNKNE